MATSKFKKIIIIGHKDEEEKLIDSIHKLGLVEIINLKENEVYDQTLLQEKQPKRHEDLDSILKELQCSIDFIKAFKEKKSFFETLAAQKPILDFNKINQITADFNRSLFCKKTEDIKHAERDLEIKTERLTQKKIEVSSWIKLGLPLQEIGYTTHTASHIGTIRRDKFASFKEDLIRKIPDLIIEKIDENPSTIFLYVLYLKTEEENVSSLLKNHGFNYAYFPDFNGTPEEILDEANQGLSEIEREKAGLFRMAKALLDKKDKIFILYDYFNNLRKRDLAEKNFLYTQGTFILEGWVRHRDINKVKGAIEEHFKNTQILIKNPSETDKIPVELENKKVFEPFEFVTKIYGLPAYNEVDPTPFLAPFFFVFFGFCMSDAGYGVIISFLSWLALKKFKMGPQGKRFFKLFFYCGISTIIIGALTGGWFGNIVDMLAEAGMKPFLFLRHIKNSLVILDPQKEPMKLLIIALCLGVIQIWFGYVIAIYGNLKNRRFLDAILDQGSMLLFLLGFTGLILAFFGLFSKYAAAIFLKILIFGSLCIVLTQGRSNPGIGSKLFFGIYALYNTFSGYISDVLSYSRLWALGLVTGVMASTCNLMAVMIRGLVPYIGILFTISILVGGHLITLLMNLLGAFIHPVRLQFVEFFSKFFRGGGKPFTPLKIQNKYTVLSGDSSL